MEHAVPPGMLQHTHTLSVQLMPILQTTQPDAAQREQVNEPELSGDPDGALSLIQSDETDSGYVGTCHPLTNALALLDTSSSSSGNAWITVLSTLPCRVCMCHVFSCLLRRSYWLFLGAIMLTSCCF